MLIVFSGSSFLFPTFFGAMKALIDRGLSRANVSFAGTSGGAIAAALFANGIHPSDALQVVKDNPPGDLITFNPYFWQPARHLGCYSLSKFESFIRAYTPRTFSAAKHPLTVIATNLDKKEGVYFSNVNTPTVDVALAVRASCSIPFLFSPVEINGQLMADGGVVNTFAVDLKNGGDNVIGIRVVSSKESMTSKVSTRMGFVTSVVGSMLNEILKEHMEDGSAAKVITIQSPFFSLDPDITSRDIDEMYSIGYRTTFEAVSRKKMLQM